MYRRACFLLDKDKGHSQGMLLSLFSQIYHWKWCLVFKVLSEVRTGACQWTIIIERLVSCTVSLTAAPGDASMSSRFLVRFVYGLSPYFATLTALGQL